MVWGMICLSDCIMVAKTGALISSRFG